MRGTAWVLATLLGLASAGTLAAAAGTLAAAGPRGSTGPIAFTEIRKITASDAASGDYFGGGAISGDTAIVGSPGNDDNGDWSGSAYIFEIDYGGRYAWGQRKKLLASDAQMDDAFGGRVAISGDHAVVRADGEDAAGSLVGAAYVFGRDHGGPDNWGQVKKLMPSAPIGSIEGWGTPAIGGDTIAVGCLHSCGVVHVFDRDHNGTDTWGEVKKVTAFDAATFDRFGQSLAISHVKKKIAADDAERDWFGDSVAISGDTIAVGAPGDDSACPLDAECNSGAVYIFERDLGGLDKWGQAMKLVAGDAEAGDSFGVVSISGDTLLVGAAGDDDACPADPSCNSGAVYVFSRNHGGLNAWGFVQKLTAMDAAAGDRFALPSISGDTVLVGAKNNDDACASDPYCNSGSAYVFMPPGIEIFVGEESADLPGAEEER